MLQYEPSWRFIKNRNTKGHQKEEPRTVDTKAEEFAKLQLNKTLLTVPIYHVWKEFDTGQTCLKAILDVTV